MPTFIWPIPWLRNKHCLSMWCGPTHARGLIVSLKTDNFPRACVRPHHMLSVYPDYDIYFTINILLCWAFVEIESPRAFVEIESLLTRTFGAFYSMINSIVLFCVWNHADTIYSPPPVHIHFLVWFFVYTCPRILWCSMIHWRLLDYWLI